jgi:hypothetical protein
VLASRLPVAGCLELPPAWLAAVGDTAVANSCADGGTLAAGEVRKLSNTNSPTSLPRVCPSLLAEGKCRPANRRLLAASWVAASRDVYVLKPMSGRSSLWSENVTCNNAQHVTVTDSIQY